MLLFMYIFFITDNLPDPFELLGGGEGGGGDAGSHRSAKVVGSFVQNSHGKHLKLQNILLFHVLASVAVQTGRFFLKKL